MTRALIVTHYVPRFPASGSLMRDYCLAREMARRHEVTFLLPDYGEESRAQAAGLAEFCPIRYFYCGAGRPWPASRRIWFSVNRRLPIEKAFRQVWRTPETVQALEPLFPGLRSALRETDWRQWDLLQIQHSNLAAAIEGVEIPVPTVLDWHNVYSVVEARRLQMAARETNTARARYEYWRVRRSERGVARRFNKSLAVSDDDADAIRALWDKASVSVVPNGVDCGYFLNREPERFESRSLVFTGTMDYAPNEEGVLFFCDRVLPQVLSQEPRTRLYIVGQRPSPAVLALEKRYPDNVTVTGFVDDVRPYLQRAAVSVVPLLNGGGTRLKILEALAMQKPVVSTSVGAEGLALVDGQEILIADDQQSFAQAVLALLADSALGRRLAAKGHSVVRQQFDWKQIGLRLEEAWREATNGH